MQDYCIRVSAGKGRIRAFAATTTNLVGEACKRHKTFPTASAALGRVLTASLMMGLMLKGDDLVTIRILGDGPLGAVVASANAKGQTRGYVQEPQTQTPSLRPGKMDVGSAVGKNGMLHVTKDLGLKEPYTGSVPLVSGEIAEDLAYYYQVSEQTPSAVALGVLVDVDNSILAAGGFIIQLMPDTSEEMADELESRINALPSLSELIRDGELPEDILGKILGDFEMVVHEKIPVEFHCPCSKSRLEKVLISLGQKELDEIIAEENGAQLICHFCAEEYDFSNDELKTLIQEVTEQK
jgi:molecular chaperone Hsp33